MILMLYGQRVVSWWTPPPASQHWHVLLWEDKVCGCDRLRLAEKKCICRMWIFLPMTYHCSLHGFILRPEASTLFGSIWMDHFLQFGFFSAWVFPCFCCLSQESALVFAHGKLQLPLQFPRNFDGRQVWCISTPGNSPQNLWHDWTMIWLFNCLKNGGRGEILSFSKSKFRSVLYSSIFLLLAVLAKTHDQLDRPSISFLQVSIWSRISRPLTCSDLSKLFNIAPIVFWFWSLKVLGNNTFSLGWLLQCL